MLRRYPILLFLLLFSQTVIAGDWYVEVPLDDEKTLIGNAIHWNDNIFYVLGRDGDLSEFDLSLAPKTRKLDGEFKSFSKNEMRTQLTEEFGREYKITSTRHYLVVSPVGQPDLWSSRFEELNRHMVRYFTSRGIAVTPPQFPLVAVVFPTREAFERHAKDSGVASTDGVLGYYDMYTNRVLMFDETGGRKGTHDWRETASTVIHEAAHQTAFNIGVQSRWSSPSIWISEGLGTLFEAKGVNNPSRYRKRADRINVKHLVGFNKRFPEGIKPDSIRSLVASDAGFNKHPLPAYSASWALTFMISEKQPYKLAQYLQKINDRRVFFQPLSPQVRLEDFESVFGSDYLMMASRLNRFISKLEVPKEK